MDFDAAKIFTKIIELGSFTSAAQHLNIPKPTVSRKITSLEESLGVRLIERSTRQLRLTPNGERFLQYALQITEIVDDVQRDFQSLKEEPRGIIKIAISPLIGELFIHRILTEYMKMYPQVQVHVQHTAQQLDPIKDSVDVIIWSGSLPKANLIAKWISNSWQMLYASPSYIQKHGVPSSIDELENHQCIQLNSDLTDHWILHSKNTSKKLSPKFIMNTNNFWLARDAVLLGKGIALLPVLLMGEDARKNQLINILPKWMDNQGAIYAIFPSRKLLAPQVRAFLDLLDKSKDRSLISHNPPSLQDPNIQFYLKNMRLSSPKIIFDFNYD